ncbi:MAG TPA: hypothetical protein PLF01_05880, partial [Alphaproteobacteria bacterium]|nr:hypothetical protein [Alphaproteobacteria bacterium]
MSNYHVGIFISRIFIALVALFILLGFHSPPTLADTLGEDNTYDIILEVKRDRKTLATAIFGLDREGKYYVPIQELARIVSFNAKTDLKTGTVSGFFISEENSYTIDTQNNTYTLRGNTYEFDPREAFVFSQQLGIGDVYVTPDLLNKIWPLDLALDPLKQVLDIQSAKKLPYELSIARQRKRNSRLNRLAQQDNTDLDLPRIDNSYKMFSLPALDFTSTTRFGGSEGGIGQNINIRGGNDLFKTQSNYNFSFDKEQSGSFKFTNARLLMERKSYEEGELPAGLQLMQFGDVRPRPSRLIDGALVGRGILLSSEPQKQIRDFDQITVEGTAEPGWEVELYRGNELIDYQVVNNQGEYRFENVTLNYSNTTIKTVLYGPEGQVKEIEENYNISDAMLRPGKNIFEASILDLNRDLIPSDNDVKNQPKGLAQNYKYKRGINSWLSAFATLTSMPTIDKTRNYATIGTNLSFMGISGLAEVYKDLSGGTAYDFRAASTFQGANLNLRTSFYSGFESEEARFDDAARKSRTEFSLSKPFKTFLGTLGLRFKLNHERFVKNPDRTEFDFSQTFAKNGLRITHGNTFNLSDRSYQNADGRINATYRLNTHWTLRSLLNYDIYPESHIRNLLSEIRYRNGSKFTAAFDIDRSFQNDGTRFGAEASYDFEKFRAGFNTDWDRENGLRAFLRATFSMAPYGQNGDYIFSSKNLSNRGALNANVYLDKNYDGQFDEGDEPIQDAKVDIGRRETNLSDESGYASYAGSPKDEYENIT